MKTWTNNPFQDKHHPNTTGQAQRYETTSVFLPSHVDGPTAQRRQQTKAAYGLQRLLVDEKSRTKAILKPGEWKSLTIDHVRIRPGAADQGAIVRWIFEEFLRVRSSGRN
jgi:hypothetical protein